MQRIREIFETEALAVAAGFMLGVLGWLSRTLLGRLNAWNQLRGKLPGRREKAGSWKSGIVWTNSISNNSRRTTWSGS